MPNGYRTAVLACALALSLSSCSTAPASHSAVNPSLGGAPSVRILSSTVLEPSDDERIDKAILLLGDGKPASAHVELQTVLTKHPANRRARRLIDQIDQDPKVLLGQKAYAYRVQPGETLSILAQRFLGDRLLFYALARYNGISVPSATAIDQVLLIPGTPKKSRATKATAVPPDGSLKNLFARTNPFTNGQ